MQRKYSKDEVKTEYLRKYWQIYTHVCGGVLVDQPVTVEKEISVFWWENSAKGAQLVYTSAVVKSQWTERVVKITLKMKTFVGL